MGRIVVITAQNLASNRIVAPLLAELGDEIALVMTTPNAPVNSSNERTRVVRILRRIAPSFALFKLVEIHVHHLLAQLRRRTIRQLAERAGVAVSHYPNVTDAAFLADLRRARPELLLSAGPVILSEEIIELPAVATLNCHCARLPEYRGAANYIWMLINGERTAWASVQRMQVALDEGELYAERSLPIDARWSAYRLNYELAGIAGELYAATAADALRSGLPRALTRPDATPANRGLPARSDMRALRRTGRRLMTMRDVLRCI
jgi:folate-dependent phosphoribosylglycinamide formyltransferase PurN